MKYFALLTLVVIMNSCKPGYEKIEREQMLEIVSDLMILEQVVRNYDVKKQDSVRVLLKENLLKVHNVSEHQLDTNLYIYQFDSDSYRVFTKDLVEILTEKREMVNKAESKDADNNE